MLQYSLVEPGLIDSLDAKLSPEGDALQPHLSTRGKWSNDMFDRMSGGLPPESPFSDKAARETRRQIWLQIYLPLGMGVMILAALVFWVWQAEFGAVTVWADVALVVVLIPLFVLGLIILIVLAGLTYGVFWLFGWLPDPLHRLQSIIARVERGTQKGADGVARPMLVVQAVIAMLEAAVGSIVSIFRSY